ncbi:MAG: HIT family protein [Lachnospiraceae bacterium]|nr:HIT family protein [Lachnospiraceae bacterium]
MRDENCIFCKIANGKIPSRTIYENEQFRVFLDLSPAAKGHALIVPKEHYANLYELPEDLAADAMRLAKKETALMTQKLSCDGFQLVQNNGETAGQTVFHFHLHLIPRYRTDGQKIAWKLGSMSDEELDAVKDQIVS